MSSSTPSNNNNYHDENILYTSLNDTLVEEKKYLRAKAVTFISIAKVIYFCVGINGACARSFLAIFLKDADLSYTSIGIYFAVTAAGIAVATPLFGILIERTRMFSFFLKLLSIGTVISSCLLLIQFFAYDDNISETNVFYTLKILLGDFLPVSGDNVEIKRLWYLTFAGVLLSAFGRASGSVRDSAVMDVCRNSPKPNNYTYDRVRGVLSLGMGLSNIGCGAILAYTNLQDYELWFVSTSAMLLITILIFPFSNIWEYNFKEKRNMHEEEEEESLSSSNNFDNNNSNKRNKSSTVCGKMCKLVSNGTMLVFLLVSVANGMGNATYDIYILLRLKQLNASYFLIGLTAGFGSLTNFVFFYITPYIRKKFGNRWMIIISMLTFCIRSGIYSMINDRNYWIVLIAQSLHGLNFSVMFAGSIGYLNEKTKDNGLTVFARSIFSFAFTGIGGVIGNLLGGYLYDLYGAVLMFQVKIYITIIVMFIFCISEWFDLYIVQKRKMMNTWERGDDEIIDD